MIARIIRAKGSFSSHDTWGPFSKGHEGTSAFPPSELSGLEWGKMNAHQQLPGMYCREPQKGPRFVAKHHSYRFSSY